LLHIDSQAYLFNRSQFSDICCEVRGNTKARLNPDEGWVATGNPTYQFKLN
jgi:hypothetical protein